MNGVIGEMACFGGFRAYSLTNNIEEKVFLASFINESPSSQKNNQTPVA
jgi:hypothetical protein